MDVLGTTAGVIAVVTLSTKVASACIQYSRAVKHAASDIAQLHDEIKSLQDVLADLRQRLAGANGSRLLASQKLHEGLDSCLSELKNLDRKLKPSKTRHFIGQIGIHALKWPFESKEVDKVVQRLERFKNSISLALQVDQTTLTQGVNQKIDLAKLPVAAGAAFNSYSDELDARCHSDTRVELRHQIRQWAGDPKGKCIFWLCGVAGTGKSTISRTVAQSLADEELLAASFFFKRGERDRENASRFFTTITAQMTVRVPTFSTYVSETIEADPGLIEKSLREQFEKLISQPLSKVEFPQEMSRLIIVIDALDECEREGDIKTILHLLAQIQNITSVSVRVFVTSRPELPVRLGFKSISGTAHQDLLLHEIPRLTIEHDITTFVKYELGKIRDDHNSSRSGSPLPEGWPGKQSIQILVEMAIPLFIFAATVCRFIGDMRWDPEEQLRIVLTSQTASQASKLDRTYLPVLDRLLFDLTESEKRSLTREFQAVVGSIVLLANPLSAVSLARLVGVEKRIVDCRLNSLHSVLSVPTNQDTPVRLLHLSFREFLIDPEKRGKSPFWVDQKKTHEMIAIKCLESMSCSLKENVCDLKSPGTIRTEIDRRIIDDSLPAHVQYAYCYWVYHLEQGEIRIYDGCPIHLFFLEHFLHWLEALALVGRLAETIELITTLNTCLDVTNGSQLRDFLVDAKRFIMKNRSIIDLAPLQLYSSAIIFTPESSIVRNLFRKKCLPWLPTLPKAQLTWSAELQTLEGHTNGTSAVAFSYDSKLLASASYDKTVRLWDPATGMTVQILEGHTDEVTAVAFSYNGKLLASASNDKTVRLWDPATGTRVQTLEGHTDGITAVAFSHGDKLLASASNDKTVRLWNPVTKMTVQTLEGHTDEVTAVAFSHDGKLLASASWDKTIRLWDPATGTTMKTLESHKDRVTAVAFLHASNLLASASWDDTVRLWDPATGKIVQTLEGHTDGTIGMTAMAFSYDGKLLASISWDEMIRLWDPATGTTLQTLKGHTQWATAVAFSYDNELLASASSDKTVRLWDPATGTMGRTLESHILPISEIAFSHDGKLLASASYDKTIRLWDPVTGTTVQTLKGHVDAVATVAFSYDSELLASASYDKTIRLWDPVTGTIVQTLEGHIDAVMAVAFSYDSELLASASYDKTIRLWDPITGTTVQTIEGHIDAVTAVAFSYDSELLASASYDKTIRLWDPVTGTTVQTLEGHIDAVTAVAFSYDSELLASASYDKTIRLWDPITGTTVQTIEGHIDAVTAVAFSYDSELLASASYDKTIRLWDPVTGTTVQTLEGHIDAVTAVAFSFDGKLLASASNDNTVRLWDLITGTMVQTFNGKEIVRSVRFSADGKYLETSWGSLRIHQPAGEVALLQTPVPQLHIFLQDDWVVREKERFLWLPPDYRSRRSAFHNDILAIGLPSGRVIFISFSGIKRPS